MKEPNLRFSGFTLDWEKTSLGNICILVMGQSPNSESYNSDGEGLPLIQGNADMANGRTKSERYTSAPLKVCDINDVVLTVRAPVGELSLASEKSALGRGVCSLSATNLNNEFLYYLLSSKKKAWKTIEQGSTFTAISGDDIRSFMVSVPDDKEQEKIASFFTLLDKKIALAERKLDNIYKLRDLLLEELLNQGIRFTGASGKHFPDWKSVTISDVSTDLSYGINAAATKFDGKHRYIRITDIDDKTHEYLSDNPVSPDKIPDSKYKLKVGDILFARTGNSVGKSYIYKAEDGDLYYAGFLIRARIREEVNPYFIYLNTLTKHYSKWVSTSSQRSGQPGINSQQYGSYVLSLPCKTEQDRIADFMLGIESKISNLKRKAYTLHQLKKALLQQMFV